MSLKMFRYIEKEEVFQKLRSATRHLSNEEIYEYLDKIDTWRDLTFRFDIRDGYVVNTIITDNDTGCDIAIADITGRAKRFYHNKRNELSGNGALKCIRELLSSNRTAV